MIDSVDVMRSLEKVIQPNTKLLGIVILIVILAMRYLESNVLQSILRES